MTALGAPVERYLEALTGRLREQLGDELVGAWLFGSGALGDFNPERSDVDVQAVTARRLPRASRERLAAELAHDRLPCPVRGLEFVVYAGEDLGAREGPAFSLNLNSGPRMARHVTFDADDDPRFWFVLDVAIGRDNGRRLVGPAAREVFPELPRALVLDALLEALDWYRRKDGAWPQTVLAACRACAWARDGRWLAKGDAGRWALARLDDPLVVAAALARRDDVGAPPAAVEPLLDAVAANLRALRRS